MVAAVWPHRAVFITPMAAVAGAVADEILEAMQPSGKAYVNNGGDIAVHLPRGETFDAGIVNNPQRPMVDATIRLEEPCGIATSGWRGRSQSLGIADAVTVVADCGAAADAAATMIANAVNAEHPAIRRLPARDVKEDSDLGETAGHGGSRSPALACRALGARCRIPGRSSDAHVRPHPRRLSFVAEPDNGSRP